jgi:hypothetical protein
MDLALFDFDGTITDRETMPDFMVAAVRPMRLVAGKVLLLPLIVGYKLRIVPGTIIREPLNKSPDNLRPHRQRDVVPSFKAIFGAFSPVRAAFPRLIRTADATSLRSESIDVAPCRGSSARTA